MNYAIVPARPYLNVSAILDLEPNAWARWKLKLVLFRHVNVRKVAASGEADAALGATH